MCKVGLSNGLILMAIVVGMLFSNTIILVLPLLPIPFSSSPYSPSPPPNFPLFLLPLPAFPLSFSPHTSPSPTSPSCTLTPHSNNNLQAISCSNRATNGYLYPLDKGFIFVHKPTIYIKFEGIASVNFARMTGGAGVSRSFDFDVELKDGNVHHFSSMMK